MHTQVHIYIHRHRSIHIHLYIHLWICTYTCTLYKHVCICRFMHMYTWAREHKWVCVWAYVCVRVRVCVCVCKLRQWAHAFVCTWSPHPLQNHTNSVHTPSRQLDSVATEIREVERHVQVKTEEERDQKRDDSLKAVVCNSPGRKRPLGVESLLV